MDKTKILIVDDEMMNREMLSFMLADRYDNQLLAENGKDGLHKLACHKELGSGTLTIVTELCAELQERAGELLAVLGEPGS